MAFIPARCTQCGANIEVDDTKDAGICKHCGTAFVTEKAINNYNTYVTNDFTGANVNYVTNDFTGADVNIVGGDVNNYIIIGENALISENYQEAYEYANKALEIDAMCPKAWLLKMKVLSAQINTDKYDKNKTAEVRNCGISALCYSGDIDIVTNGECSYSPNEKTGDSEIVRGVFTEYILIASRLITEVINEINQSSLLKSLVNDYDDYVIRSEDLPIREELDTMANDAVFLLFQIPSSYLKYIPNQRDKIIQIARSYSEFCIGDKYRTSIYNYQIDMHVVRYRLDVLNQLNSMLPEGEKMSLPNLNYDPPKKKTWFSKMIDIIRMK